MKIQAIKVTAGQGKKLYKFFARTNTSVIPFMQITSVRQIVWIINGKFDLYNLSIDEKGLVRDTKLPYETFIKLLLDQMEQVVTSKQYYIQLN